ncbi:hypothetical protein AALB52_20625 [Lachnospiraceae bacterium 38-14]|uniref:hypothetical protein n=1 Tax=Roseburia sp. 1XD42-69 TaxID=2320088 RepID=UPI000EA021A5|nr:hypothetical protein [Roseburia sp. 1XD42-69]RKJ64857.1 hypothetical protein D7Y06_11195 [Roseburia sp. 1XD42-69]
MQKKETITGYCPKQDCETSIIVTYTITEAMKASYKTPLLFKCNYNNAYGTCTDCPIFKNLA